MVSGDKKTCYIIMPITTRVEVTNNYKGDSDHFYHVLEHLHIPAVNHAGFEPIGTITTGAGLITAEIIENLQTADLVLCDMSDLNPNVFFEYGIRTALNKPVCVVKDTITDGVPFDVAALNYVEYESELVPWSLDDQIRNVSRHINDSFEKTPDHNKMWNYFGLEFGAIPARSKDDPGGRMEYLIAQIGALRKEVNEINGKAKSFQVDYTRSPLGFIDPRVISARDKEEVEIIGQSVIKLLEGLAAEINVIENREVNYLFEFRRSYMNGSDAIVLNVDQSIKREAFNKLLEFAANYDHWLVLADMTKLYE